MGLPAQIRREVTPEEREGLRRYADDYLQYKESYLAELKQP
jgi:carbonic anhydrase/acetyltransferase-like protein (isoleucine patch superfamily)